MIAWKKLVLIFLMISIQPLALAGEGPITSGGGLTVVSPVNQKLIPLDLYLVNRNFVEPYMNFGNYQMDGQTKLYRKFKLNIMDIKALPEFKIALNRVSPWESYHPGLIKLIHAAFEKMTLFATEDLIKSKVEGAADIDTYTTIIYHRTQGGILSLPYWNQMGEMGRATLLIHEALRWVKLNYYPDLEEAKLLKVAGTIALQAPEQVMNFASEDYFNGKLLADMQVLDNNRQVQFKTWKVTCEAFSYALSNWDQLNSFYVKSGYIKKDQVAKLQTLACGFEKLSLNQIVFRKSEDPNYFIAMYSMLRNLDLPELDRPASLLDVYNQDIRLTQDILRNFDWALLASSFNTLTAKLLIWSNHNDGHRLSSKERKLVQEYLENLASFIKLLQKEGIVNRKSEIKDFAEYMEL